MLYCEEQTYRNYIADSIRIVTENMAMNEKQYITMRLREILDGKKPAKEPTAEEIIRDLRQRIEETE